MALSSRTVGGPGLLRSGALPASSGLGAFAWRYGQAHYGKSLFWHSSELLFAFFLTEQAGLPAMWMGAVLIAGLLSSACLDLVVGRALRRRPFTKERALGIQLIGALASASAIVALFATDLLPPVARIPYALSAALAFRLAYAFYDIPHNALLVLVTSDADTRARLASLRLAFSGLASITVATILTTLLSSGLDERAGRFAIAGFLMALVAVATSWCLARGQAPEGAPQAPVPVRSRGFLAPDMLGMLTVMAFASFAISTFTMFEPFYVAGGAGASKRAIVLAAAIGLTCSQLFWLAIVRRCSVHRAMAGALAGLAASIWLFGGADLSNVGQIAVACLFGVANGGVGMTVWTGFANSVSRHGAAGDPFAFALLTCAAKLGLASAAGGVAYMLSLRDLLGAATNGVLWGMTWPPVSAIAIACVGLCVTSWIAQQGTGTATS